MMSHREVRLDRIISQIGNKLDPNTLAVVAEAFREEGLYDAAEFIQDVVYRIVL